MNPIHSGIGFSSRVTNLHSSPIREILSIAGNPGMISFAGGLPAPETFPVLDFSEAPASCLQYGASEGDPALRESVAAELRALGLDCGADQVLILSGSQQGIDLVAKLFIDPGTPVAVESPTYLAALQVFRFFGASFLPLNSALPEAGLSAANKPAFVYTIPTFQNPTGHCYNLTERESLAKTCDQLQLPIFEDDPYRDLAYDTCERKPVCALVKKAPWIYQGSFSKSLAPGLRLGYLAASPSLMPQLIRLKQAADLHSNRLSQWFVLRQLGDPGRQARIERIVDIYRRKRDVFAQALETHFGGLARWKIPAGGLFFWLELKQQLDTRTLLPEAIKRGVAFMPGEPFFSNYPESCSALRLNFSLATDEEIERGLAILARLMTN